MTKRRVILISILVGVLAVAAAGVWFYRSRKTGPRLLAQAEIAIRAGKYDKALRLAGEYVAIRAGDWQGYYLEGQACMYLGRYADARQRLARAMELGPTRSSVALALANTHGLPARQALASRETPAIAVLDEAVAQLRRANEILAEFKSDDESGMQDVREAAGLNRTRIGQALQMKGERLQSEALLAETSRLTAQAEAKRKESEAALATAKESFEEGIGMLLEVVRQDPSREHATEMLVRVCLERNDEATLDAVREAIASVPDPPPIAQMMIVMHDFRISIAQADRITRRKKTVEACEAVDGLLRRRPDDEQIKLERARLALALSDLETAERLCREVLQVNPRQGQARLLQARTLMEQGNVPQAEQILFSLKTDFPRWPMAHYVYAQAATSAGKKELALDALRTVTRLDPGHAAALRFLAETLLRDGFYVEAFKDAKAYYEAAPDEPAALRIFAEAALRRDQPALARKILEEASAKHASRPEILMAVVGAYRLMGDNEAAGRVAKQAAAIEGTTTEARLSVAQALVSIGRGAEAEKILNEEMARDGDDARVRFGLGRLYRATGRLLQAMEQHRAAVRLDPAGAAYRLALAETLINSGSPAECEEALEPLPASNIAAALLRMQARLLQGKMVDTEKMLGQLEEKGQSGVPVALAHLAHGKAEKCVEICLLELEITPDDPDLRLVLGRAYLVMGEFDKSIEQWTLLLKAAPGQLSAYVRLSAVLSRRESPEQVSRRMASIPGARQNLVDMATGLLFARRGEHSQASEVFNRIVERDDVPDYLHGRAQLLRAQSLVSAGQADRALVILDALSYRTTWRAEALYGKALLLRGRRQPEARKALADLHELALEKKDLPLLRRAAGLYMNMDMSHDALAVCDEMMGLRPNDAGAYVLKANILAATGKMDEAVECYRGAIERQPGNFAAHLAMAGALDRNLKPLEAMNVLQELEKTGRAGQAAGLLAQGSMFARWGLQAEAIRCFERLAEIGHEGNPRVQSSLGRAFAILGEKDRARAALRAIPRYAPQYVPAQQLLADLADAEDQKLRILRELKKAKPDQASIYLREMTLLARANRPGEAVKVFEDLLAGRPEGTAPPSAAASLAMECMLRAGDRDSAAKLCVRMAGQTGNLRWRQMAVLLTLETQPEVAASFLPPPAGADLHSAVLGLCLESRRGGATAKWAERVIRIDERLSKLTPPRSVPTGYKILLAVATRATQEAKAEPAKSGAVGGVSRSVVAELVSSADKRAGAPAEAINLLEASVAIDLGAATLGRAWLKKTLKARPTCQYAAALALGARPSLQEVREILDVLQPGDCVLARTVRGRLLMMEKKYDEAVKSYRLAAEAEQDNADLLVTLAMATEYAGHLPEALKLYRQVWQASKNPIAANNGAYLVSVLHPKDAAKLAEAAAWMEEVLKGSPTVQAFRDTGGWIAYLRGDAAKALPELRAAVKGLPGSAEAHYHLGAAEAAAGQAKLARWHLAAAVNIGKKLEAEGAELPKKVADAVRGAREVLDGLEKESR